MCRRLHIAASRVSGSVIIFGLSIDVFTVVMSTALIALLLGRAARHHHARRAHAAWQTGRGARRLTGATLSRARRARFEMAGANAKRDVPIAVLRSEVRF